MTHTGFWVYILHCQNNTYYTGYTNDMDKRYQAHCSGQGSKYTRSFKPTRIALCWPVDGDKSLAMHLERCIKKLSRQEKEALIANPDRLRAMIPGKQTDSCL
ncbi:GIY-YIG nuclease family protein [Legionella sp. CNM-4043-24]|uniref:GIY-YIG nuclease family protein n=1 Tax=Legionella sp. CNM-4043-24 TaxID=3421646 RepID=UPI00403AC0B7